MWFFQLKTEKFTASDDAFIMLEGKSTTISNRSTLFPAINYCFGIYREFIAQPFPIFMQIFSSREKCITAIAL